MIRESKFRAKVKWSDNQRTKGDWIYGNLVKKPIPEYKCGMTTTKEWVWAIQESCPNNGTSYVYETIEIDPDTVGLFTEVLDINKVGIYEDDIFEEEGWEEEYYTVHFEYGCFKANRSNKRMYSNNDRPIEGHRHQARIVGNVYDNPELLK